MTIREYRTLFTAELSTLYDAGEAESFFLLLLQDRRQLSRADLALQPGLQFSAEELQDWNNVLGQLRNEIPIQYILGKTQFYGAEFMVNSNVLIPRPETEELVEWIVSNSSHQMGPVRILDIGTGSGCIAVSLARHIPAAEVFAIDVSDSALEVAMQNAQRNGVNVNFIQRDILQTKTLEHQFDIIVSNPPYVRNLEKQEIRNNVLSNEPHLALFVDDNDPLVFYNKIAALAQAHLKPGGRLYFEINQYMSDGMMQLLTEKGFQQVELRKDIYGNYRMSKAVIRSEAPQ